jgi:hypothetical protein
MTEYLPDNWVIIKIKGDDSLYKVLAGWSGGYITADSWRMNSGITRVEEDEVYFKFFGSSGSCYYCNKQAYGLRMNNVYVWNALVQKHDDKVELMPEETDWMNVDWIIGK